jgi:hypothetical protein
LSHWRIHIENIWLDTVELPERIRGKNAINEDPKIIIRRHGEGLSWNVLNVSVDFVGKKIIVIHILVAKQLIINRKKRRL